MPEIVKHIDRDGEDVGIVLNTETRVARCDKPCPFNSLSLRSSLGTRVVLCTAVNLWSETVIERATNPLTSPEGTPLDTEHFPTCAFPTRADVYEFQQSSTS